MNLKDKEKQQTQTTYSNQALENIDEKDGANSVHAHCREK